MRRMIDRLGWVAAAVLALALAASLAGVVRGGSLDPPAGPGSTMKTLDQIPGSWSQKLSASAAGEANRFQLVLPYGLLTPSPTAALDRETGLVWELAPSGGGTWVGAVSYCAQSRLGGRGGWRLPTLDEANSLVEKTPLNEGLPAGHPFTIPLGGMPFWTQTLSPDNNSMVWAFEPKTGWVSPIYVGTYQYNAWCVRGPMTGRAGSTDLAP